MLRQTIYKQLFKLYKLNKKCDIWNEIIVPFIGGLIFPLTIIPLYIILSLLP